MKIIQGLYYTCLYSDYWVCCLSDRLLETQCWKNWSPMTWCIAVQLPHCLICVPFVNFSCGVEVPKCWCTLEVDDDRTPDNHLAIHLFRTPMYPWVWYKMRIGCQFLVVRFDPASKQEAVCTDLSVSQLTNCCSSFTVALVVVTSFISMTLLPDSKNGCYFLYLPFW